MIPVIGHIYWANLPYEENLQSGRRPVVVTQNNTGNKHGPRVHVVPLTSNVKKAYNLPTHVVLEPSDKNGLAKSSVALAEDLRPIPKANLVSWIGKLNKAEHAQINEAVKLHLGLG